MSKSQLNLLMIGAPGVGKTAKVEATYNGNLVKLLLSSCVEEDISGLPYRQGDQEMRTRPKWLRDLENLPTEKGRKCLFLDELDKARQEVADTLLTLVESRKVGDWRLGDDVDIVAAANPPEYGGGNGISPAMQNRFTILEVHPCAKEWGKWAMSVYPEFENIIKAVSIGEIPIYEEVGEGYDTRVCNPRTLVKAFETAKSPLVANGLISYMDAINGLLPPSVAVHFYQNKPDLAIRSHKVLRSAGKANNHKPLRL